MTTMSADACHKLVAALAGALKGLRLYPLQHPIIRKQFQELTERLQQLLADREQLPLGLLDGTLFAAEQLFAEPFPAAESLGQRLQELEIIGLEFLPGIDEDELRVLLQGINQGAFNGPDALVDFLREQELRHVRLLSGEGGEDSGEGSARGVYDRALKVVNSIFHDVRLGRIPSSGEAKRVVKDMVRTTLADPHALLALSMLKDYDNYTFTHSVNVAVLALAVGRATGFSEEQLRTIGFGALLHDLGKLKIDLAIINKPARLSESEYREILKHPQFGAAILEQMEGTPAGSRDIVLGHHLHYDRKGYPQNCDLGGPFDLIDITTIADTYDAITTLRPYQAPISPRQAIQDLRGLSGTLLHPDYLEAFIFSLGNNPVGTLVRLDNNEIGLVNKVGLDDPNAVELKILFDREGRPLAQPVPLHLPASEQTRMVAEVDPFLKGVNLAQHF